MGLIWDHYRNSGILFEILMNFLLFAKFLKKNQLNEFLIFFYFANKSTCLKVSAGPYYYRKTQREREEKSLLVNFLEKTSISGCLKNLPIFNLSYKVCSRWKINSKIEFCYPENLYIDTNIMTMPQLDLLLSVFSNFGVIPRNLDI